MQLKLGALIFAVSVATSFVSATKEKATGFDFPKKNKLGALKSLGVRKKGPIKVYAVGMYEDVFKAPGFVLKMNMGVGAEKMTNARSARVGESRVGTLSGVRCLALPRVLCKRRSVSLGPRGCHQTALQRRCVPRQVPRPHAHRPT